METWTQEERDFHEAMMTRALETAAQAREDDEVPVGCVFVRDGKVIAQSFNNTNHSKNATRHAEIECIDRLLAQRSIAPADHPFLTEDDFPEPGPDTYRDVDVYVTLEPCIMCAAALRRLGVRHVFFGAFNDKFGGAQTVLNVLSNPNLPEPPVPFTGGILAGQAVGILKFFYQNGNVHAPVSKRKRPLRVTKAPPTKVAPTQTIPPLVPPTDS